MIWGDNKAATLLHTRLLYSLHSGETHGGSLCRTSPLELWALKFSSSTTQLKVQLPPSFSTNPFFLLLLLFLFAHGRPTAFFTGDFKPVITG